MKNLGGMVSFQSESEETLDQTGTIVNEVLELEETFKDSQRGPDSTKVVPETKVKSVTPGRTGPYFVHYPGFLTSVTFLHVKE